MAFITATSALTQFFVNIMNWIFKSSQLYATGPTIGYILFGIALIGMIIRTIAAKPETSTTIKYYDQRGTKKNE